MFKHGAVSAGRLLRRRRLTMSIAAVVCGTPSLAMAAPNVEFNANLLQGGAVTGIDLTRFERGETQPGTYSADVRVNGVLVARRDVEVRALADGDTVVMLSPALIDVLGIDRAKLPQDEGAVALPVTAFDAAELFLYVPQASANFDAGEQVLDVSVPQLYLARDPRGWVRPELWDGGINAARIDYSIGHQQFSGNGYQRQSTTATVDTGLNLGDWRVRHSGYISAGSGQRTRYRAQRTYAKRSLPALGMELTVGQASTRGDLFGGVNYQGVSLSTDPRMLPDSQRDYAPVVRGVAQTNAKIVIRQLENVIYQTNVAPGPFEIDDLYGTAYAGDLNVEVTEADGRIQRFVVPFAAVPELLRAGQQRLSATVGQLDDQWTSKKPAFAEVSVRRGLSNHFTAVAGLTATQGYGAAVVGGAWNTRYGAFSGDVTLSRATLTGPVAGFGHSMSGQSFRLAYSKDISQSGTNIAMAAYRYSTDGYLTLAEAAALRQRLSSGFGSDRFARQRSRFDITLNQRLAEGAGALYASGSTADYWNQSNRQTNYSVGYTNSWRLASYSVSVQRSKQESLFGSTAVRDSTSFNFNVSVPLGLSVQAPRLNATTGHETAAGTDYRLGMTGTFGERRQGSYNGSFADGRGSNGFDVGVGYQASVASLNAGYSRSSGGRSLTLGASGGVIIHGDGVAFSQQLGETVALLQVPGAAGAVVDSSIGVKTNAKGYAVVPYMQPYRRNSVTVDPKGLPMDVELKEASVTGVPTAGAIVKLIVPTDSGRSALIEAPMSDGTPLPFGVDVYNEAGDVVGVVGQASRLWVRGIEQKGQLFVRWNNAGEQQCVINYDVSAGTAEMSRSSCELKPGALTSHAPQPVDEIEGLQ